MKFGVTMFPAHYAMNVVDLGRAAEEHGFDSLFLPEHTHIPSGRGTPWPSGGELPEEYKNTLDPFVSLAAVAAVTTTLKLGTGICLVIQRDPIVTAKEVASLDFISNGRFLFGIGAGWNREEIENHGTAYKTRFSLMRERVLAMKEIWANDEAEFHGKFVDFDPIWSWPKPVQKPHPPILMGGDVPQSMNRVVDYGDEWLPHPGRGDQSVADRVGTFRRLCEEAGRGRIPVTMFGAPLDANEVEIYQEGDVDGCVFRVPPAGSDVVLPFLKECAEVVKRFG
jgi:probable F420-dependent oxidoreductase